MSGIESAVLAGGCFWGMQDLFRRAPGVISTRVGYTGGEAPNATYLDHGTHAEATEIVFDPSELSYRRLLEFFFQIHDPTTRNRQANDAGASYRSAISYSNEPQRSEAERGFRNQTFWKATRRRIRYKYALRAGTTTLTRVPCASLV